MAMTMVQQNVCSKIQAIAIDLIAMQQSLTSLGAMWTNENIGSLTDADFAELAPFAHITAAEFVAAGGALVAINTTLGSGAGSNWAKLLKIVTTVP